MASSARETVRQLLVRAVAEAIVARLPTGGSTPLAEVGIAGPGFINLRLAPSGRAGGDETTTKEDDG